MILALFDHHIFLCTKTHRQKLINLPKQVPIGRGNFADQNLISSVLMVMIRHFTQKVLNFEKPWNGYRYWMAYTPYPGADQRKENPHVCVSNDRIHWKPFEGEGKAVSLDPLTPFEDPDKQYNSDTHLVYRKISIP